VASYAADPDEYDDNAVAAALHLIIRGSAKTAADATAALLMSGFSRQMRYDALVPRALKDGKFSADERAQIAGELGRGRIDVPRAEPSARTSVIHVRVTPDEREQIESAAMAAGQSTSDLVRERLLGS